mmetsp:Transcript_10165/g.34549  ORF Transcript_10165/g.34549 Transcript_10165/m.34549 type:complete len:358 (+) Transcript_10165:282-1355(+)
MRSRSTHRSHDLHARMEDRVPHEVTDLRARASGLRVVERLAVDLAVGVGAAREVEQLVRRVDHGHGAPEDDARVEGHPPLDLQLGAVEQRWRAVRAQLVKGVHELVPVVELDHRRHAVAAGRELHAEVARGHVRVRAERQEVRGGLDGGEARARDADRDGPLEAGDGGAHGCLQLEDLGGGLVPRVHGLCVCDERQREEAVVLDKLRLEGNQVDPEVVGVEVLVLGHVLEGVLVLLGALGRLAEEEVPRAGVPGEVAALLVRFGALRHLHHEGRLLARKVGEQLEVQRGPQVVRVGHEHVLLAVGEELVEGAAPEERRVEVAVARRAPLQGRVRGPVGGRKGGRVHLGGLVLHELEV